MREQTVVRTRSKVSKYFYESDAFSALSKRLAEGWCVTMVNPIGEELEYILEREKKDGKE